MHGLGSDLVGLTAEVEGLSVTGLHLQNKLETVLGVALLIHADVAVGAEQVAVLDRLVDSGQVLLQTLRGRLLCVETLQGF